MQTSRARSAATAGLAVAAAVIITLAVMELRGYSFDDVSHWILLLVGVAFLAAALVIYSAPPERPNVFERIAGLDGPTALMVTGIVVTGVGTMGLFDFGPSDRQEPSLWWAAVVGTGVLLSLIGVARFAKPPADARVDR